VVLFVALIWCDMECKVSDKAKVLILVVVIIAAAAFLKLRHLKGGDTYDKSPRYVEPVVEPKVAE